MKYMYLSVELPCTTIRLAIKHFSLRICIEFHELKPVSAEKGKVQYKTIFVYSALTYLTRLAITFYFCPHSLHETITSIHLN